MCVRVRWKDLVSYGICSVGVLPVLSKPTSCHGQLSSSSIAYSLSKAPTFPPAITSSQISKGATAYKFDRDGNFH